MTFIRRASLPYPEDERRYLRRHSKSFDPEQLCIIRIAV